MNHRLKNFDLYTNGAVISRNTIHLSDSHHIELNALDSDVLPKQNR